jgi:hypothetical protein
MKLFLWLLWIIWTLLITGALYIEQKIIIETVVFIEKTIVFLLVIWVFLLVLKVLLERSEEDYLQPKKKRYKFPYIMLKVVWIILLLGMFLSTWDYVWNWEALNNIAENHGRFITNHVEFPWDGKIPKIYIGDKPQINE